MAKKIIDKKALENYFRKAMYTQVDGKWKFVTPTKLVDGWKNKPILDVAIPMQTAILKAYAGKTELSNRKVIAGLQTICNAIGLDKDIDGQDIKFLSCDADVIRREYIKAKALDLTMSGASKDKLVKVTLKVIGKRYRRKYYTANDTALNA